MTPVQRQQVVDALKALERELSAKGARKVEPTKTDDVEKPDEEDDQPLTEMLQSIASNRNANDLAVLGKVRKALARATNEPEELGLCQDCGDDIPFGRLKAMPYAELCVDCQGKKDPKHGSRKKLTDYT